MASGWHRKRDTAAVRARRGEYRKPEYREAEAKIAAQVKAGAAYCWRCGRPLSGGKDEHGHRLWHVGHDDHDRRVIRGGECADCNRKAGARAGARTRNATPSRARF